MTDLVQFGNKGKGESVWLGFFLYNVLDRFNRICKNVKGKDEYAKKYEGIMRNLKATLNENAWDRKLV